MKTVIGLAWVALSVAVMYVVLDHVHDGEDATAVDPFDLGPDDEDPPIYLAVKADHDYLAWLDATTFHDSSP